MRHPRWTYGSAVILTLFTFTLMVQQPAGAADKPGWYKKFNGHGRFVVLSRFNREAVLDKETGLVWEQSPLTTTHMWNLARRECTSRTVGGRKGWRLPGVHELASLVDPGNPGGNPDLPAGHPFSNVQSDIYWSASRTADSSIGAWAVIFAAGNVVSFIKTGSAHVWCVRGGMNADQY